MQFKNLKDLRAIKGQHESSTLEFKREVIDTEKLLDHILGFLNGHAPVGQIILGIDEDEKGCADTNNFSPIEFPLQINGGKTKINNFDEYKLHLLQSLRIYLPQYLEGMIKLEYVAESLIIITINQSELRPLTNKNNKVLIRRDASTSEMSMHEFAKAIEERIKRQSIGDLKNPYITELEAYRNDISSNEILIKRNETSYKFPNFSYYFLYLAPGMPNNYKRVELKEMARNGLGIFGNESIKGISYEHNKYGVVLFDPNDELDTVTQLSQLFFTGSILGIESLKPWCQEGNPNYFPIKYLEKACKSALQNFLSFAEQKLANTLPFRLTLGIVNIEGFRLMLPNGYPNKLSNPIYDKNIILKDIEISNYACKAEEILEPFFEKVWDSVGLSKPSTI